MFGDKLKKLRKEKKLSQEELGLILKVSKMTISNWEANSTEPSLENINELAKYFDVTPNYLLGFANDDLERVEKLKYALKDAGLMANDDLTIEELEKALKIIDVMRDRIDTEK